MRSLAIMALLSASATASAAPVLVDGFESGFSAWQTLGDASIQTASIGLNPTQGTQLAFLSTISTRDATSGFDPLVTPYSGTSSPVAAEAAAFLGLSGLLTEMPPSQGEQVVGDGSAIKVRFYAPIAGVVSFDWNRIGRDGDFAYVSLWSDELAQETRVSEWLVGGADSAPWTIPFMSSGVDLCARTRYCEFINHNVETGWKTGSLTVQSAGWYWLGFATGEIAEWTVPTVLAVDNVRFEAANELPEPSSYVLVGGALLLAGVASRTGRKQRKA